MRILVGLVIAWWVAASLLAFVLGCADNCPNEDVGDWAEVPQMLTMVVGVCLAAGAASRERVGGANRVGVLLWAACLGVFVLWHVVLDARPY